MSDVVPKSNPRRFIALREICPPANDLFMPELRRIF
jgi:hypothetical protein